MQRMDVTENAFAAGGPYTLASPMRGAAGNKAGCGECGRVVQVPSLAVTAPLQPANRAGVIKAAVSTHGGRAHEHVLGRSHATEQGSRPLPRPHQHRRAAPQVGTSHAMTQIVQPGP